MTAQFMVRGPEQLRKLAGWVKGDPKQLEILATVWPAARRQNGNEETPLDGKVAVAFETSAHSRTATVFRIGMSGKLLEIAEVKYNPAVAYCSEFMHRIEFSRCAAE